MSGQVKWNVIKDQEQQICFYVIIAFDYSESDADRDRGSSRCKYLQ